LSFCPLPPQTLCCGNLCFQSGNAFLTSTVAQFTNRSSGICIQQQQIIVLGCGCLLYQLCPCGINLPTILIEVGQSFGLVAIAVTLFCLAGYVSVVAGVAKSGGVEGGHSSPLRYVSI
jgi:hypothetical protein